MKTIKIGLIGAGQIGKQHLERYASIPGAEIAAVCDLNAEEANRVAQQYGIPQVCSDFRELLAQPDIDAVDVCLHNNFHEPVSTEALLAGKHVYCEKPIAGAYADGLKMVETAKRAGRMLHIQLGQLYTKETKTAKQLIDAGKLGKLYHARSTGFRRRNRPYVDGYGTPAFTRKEIAGGGALFDMGVYHISQLLYLLGNPLPLRISGQLYQEMAMDEARRANSGFDVEEFAAGFVKLEGGITLDIAESWAISLGGFEGSAIVGSEGGIRFPGSISNGERHGFSFHATTADLDVDGKIDLDLADLRRRRLSEFPDAYESSQHHWVAALRGEVPLLNTAEIALHTMLISEGLYLSHEKGREVTADEVREFSVSRSVRL
ncbi:Gfo/Idh/MocA family protein [Cohnella nanjingensis]|uniref:Gfo/Idh/MocA family oxidoreductase n=1 Tax=Cohnella nanjingensis TaxID=1387779 RepID=A0A7X0RSG3_9BACL|nr:Gfo/Idh/MocA family oxidoreductase [Cohnella nanjingensis]MBB6672725.1 Gfo/Idh/MocA family oxidoreductase [Cohnella nanjingensis]